MARRRRKQLSTHLVGVELDVESLSPDGRGVAHNEGKAVFIAGALPGERVTVDLKKKTRRFDEATVAEVLVASNDRVEAGCEAFSICGGCSLQHMASEAQIHSKDQILREQFEHIGKVSPEIWLEPLIGPLWGYRNKARMSVRNVYKKNRVLVGFREKGSGYVADMRRCEVLHPSVGHQLEALSELIGSLEISDKIAQIEVAVGDSGTALVLRNLEPVSDCDRARLQTFAAAHDVWLYLQPGGPEVLDPIGEAPEYLSYELPDYNVTLEFRPTDFTQINADINRLMINQALDMLNVQDTDRVLDLFCGLGNFSLPLARRAKEVVGIEGESTLVARAAANAQRNGLDNVSFYACNLFESVEQENWARVPFDKALIDPPRTGAIEIIQNLKKALPDQLVYVSCNPATLARDAGELVHQQGYQLVSAGVMDMFPHTNHVESIALFKR